MPVLPAGAGITGQHGSRRRQGSDRFVSHPADLEDALRQGLQATRQKPVLLEVMMGDHPYPKI
jgi:hypothetical protein